MTGLPFGKPPKREKKKPRPIRQKSLRPDRDSELKKILSQLPYSQISEEKPVEKKISSITPKPQKPIQRSPIKRSPLKKTTNYKALKRTPISPGIKRVRTSTPEVEAIKAQLPGAVEKRIKDRAAMDACKALPCVISGFVNPQDPEQYKKLPDYMKVDPCHVKTRGAGAPDVWWAMIPMQRRYHSEQGSMPIKDFADKYPSYAEALEVRGWYWDECGNLWNDRLNKTEV